MQMHLLAQGRRPGHTGNTRLGRLTQTGGELMVAALQVGQLYGVWKQGSWWGVLPGSSAIHVGGLQLGVLQCAHTWSGCNRRLLHPLAAVRRVWSEKSVMTRDTYRKNEKEDVNYSKD
jgi:hypothetical protein